MGTDRSKILLRQYIFTLFIVQVVLFLGCGDSQKNEHHETTDKGSISLSVVWPGSVKVSKRALSGNPCSDYNISWIVATVYTSSDVFEKKGDPWDCDRVPRQGTIDEVTTEEQVYVRIEGFVGSVDDSPEWGGESGLLQLSPGQNNTYLVSHPILMSHTSDHTGPNPNNFEYNPENESSDVPVNASIEVRFDEQVSAITVYNDSFYITPTSDTATHIPGTVSYNPETRIALFDPSENLSPNETYVVTVVGGQAGGIVDLAGNLMTTNYTWQFTTSGSSDSEPPLVSSHAPSGSFVEIDRVIEVCFNEAMRLDSINNLTIIVQTNVSTIPGTITYQASGGACPNVAAFNPSVALDNGIEYTVTIKSGSSGLKDLAGNELATDYSWNFTTVDSQSTDLIWDQGNWDEKNWN